MAFGRNEQKRFGQREEEPAAGMQDIDLDEEIPAQDVHGFLDKNIFLQSQPPMRICNVKMGNFGKLVLLICPNDLETDTAAQWVNLNASNVNQLRDLFGPKPKAWIKGVVEITGERFSGTNRKTGEKMEGVELSFHGHED